MRPVYGAGEGGQQWAACARRLATVSLPLRSSTTRLLHGVARDADHSALGRLGKGRSPWRELSHRSRRPDRHGPIRPTAPFSSSQVPWPTMRWTPRRERRRRRASGQRCRATSDLRRKERRPWEAGSRAPGRPARCPTPRDYPPSPPIRQWRYSPCSPWRSCQEVEGSAGRSPPRSLVPAPGRCAALE